MSTEPRETDPLDEEWLAEVLDRPASAVEMLDREREAYEAGVRCEYLAVLGFLTHAVEPLAARPGLEDRVLAAAREDARGSGQDHPASRPPDSLPGAASRYHHWLLPLAASLALVAFGLAGLQARRLGSLQATIEQQSEELAEARLTAKLLADLENRNADLAGTVALLTTAGVEFCPLRPPAASPLPAAWGALAMSEDGGRWYLRVVGLEPRQDGLEYRLWFLLDGDPMKATPLEIRASDGALELANGETPERFNSVLITLEPAGSVSPEGPRLLFGNERMQIL